MSQETSIGGSQHGFQPTLWTTILRAKDASSPERQQALQSLISTYWKPVYFFIRRRGNDVETSKDLTQSFFAAFLEKDFLKNVAPEKGRFRSFLLASLTYFLSDEYDRASAKKRGGGFEFVQAEQELASSEATPEQAFFQQWAVETMSLAVARLREECTPEDFALLTDGKSQGLSVSDRKNRLHRLRSRLREHLRAIIRPSVELESDVDSEVQALFARGL
jgi:DNA-directed RNA polymerase specialized sigma24 family protein